MKAVGFKNSELVDVELPVPLPLGFDLLVEVKAVSVNPTDFKTRKRDETPGEMRILGFDVAGVVRGMGPEAENFSVGDEVFYAGVQNRPGGNAEFHLVDARLAGHKPKTLSFAEAAALPLTALTAWEMLFDRFKIPRDQAVGGTILLLGGAGGVGSIAIQLAAALTDLVVIATASRPETVAWCTKLGAHHVINHREDMAAQITALGFSAPDYIFCMGYLTEHFEAMAALLAPEGSLGIIEYGPALDMTSLMRKSATLHTENIFARGTLQTPSMSAQHRTLEAVAHLVDNGTLRSTMTEHYGLINAVNLQRAHAALETGTVRGKIVLEGFSHVSA
jgi:NADPH2:quinone reductase